MRRCIKCGTEIINGINGCAALNECIACHGGYPKYAPAVTKRESYSWDELDALEDRCINDEEM